MPTYGGLSERSIELVLKTGDGCGSTVGSIPTPSATRVAGMLYSPVFALLSP